MTAMMESDFPGLPLISRGKVRDMYDMGDAFLLVATDRISAFDVMMSRPVPGKGAVLTQISSFWFSVMEEITDHHLIEINPARFPAVCAPYADQLAGRSMLVKKAAPLPVECIVRGYITGSGWKSYQDSGSVCGIALPEGLRESEKLPEPLFTPSTKADAGAHDKNISFEQMAKLTGEDIAARVRSLSLAIYRKGARLAAEKGILIADTKFEFGIYEDEIILIDEVLTPDSSRFWPADEYMPGRGQKSFDKQYLRDWLSAQDWNREPPAPDLPDAVVENTRARYVEALERLTGTRHGL